MISARPGGELDALGDAGWDLATRLPAGSEAGAMDSLDGGSWQAAPAGRWQHRHLLDTDTLSWADIELFLQTAETMAAVLARPIPKVPALRGYGMTILF